MICSVRDKAGQLVGHRDAAHAEPERRRALDLVREAMGRADDEGHVSRAAICAVGEELGQFLGGDLFSLDAQGDDGRAPADAAEDGSALFVQRLFHHGVGGVLLFDFFFRQLDDAERRKRRQTLLVFGHALGEVFRVELATQIRSIFCMVIFSFLALHRLFPAGRALSGASRQLSHEGEPLAGRVTFHWTPEVRYGAKRAGLATEGSSFETTHLVKLSLA